MSRAKIEMEERREFILVSASVSIFIVRSTDSEEAESFRAGSASGMDGMTLTNIVVGICLATVDMHAVSGIFTPKKRFFFCRPNLKMNNCPFTQVVLKFP